MELEYVLIADAVENINGKLYMLGGCWREFRSPSFPNVARIGVAVSILLTPDEAKKSHQVLISYSEKKPSLHPPPGTQAAALNIHAQIAPSVPASNQPQRSIVAINGAFPVLRTAEYEIAVVVDGQEDKRKSVDFVAVTGPVVAMN